MNIVSTVHLNGRDISDCIFYRPQLSTVHLNGRDISDCIFYRPQL